MTDISIARYIARAESAIDTFMGFDPRNGGFEPHVVWIQEQFDERTLRTHSPNAPVPVRQVVRYRIQVSNLTGTGAGFFANIQDSDVAINVFDEYVEIVPLQSITYSLAPVLIQLGLRPPIVQEDVEIGFYLSAFGDTLYPVASLPGSYVAIPGNYAALRGFWASTYTQSLASQPATLPPIPPVIYINGVVAASNTYTINYTEGLVVFNTPPDSASVITADYTYQIPDPVRDACIEQINHLLALRAINQKGLTYLSSIQVGDVKVDNRGVALPGKATQLEAMGLCQAAAEKLQQYVPIAVA